MENDDGDGQDRRIFARRETDSYVLLTKEQLNELVASAALAAARAAVDEFIALLGRKTLRNIGIALAAALAVAVTWLSDLVHVHFGK